MEPIFFFMKTATPPCATPVDGFIGRFSTIVDKPAPSSRSARSSSRSGPSFSQVSVTTAISTFSSSKHSTSEWIFGHNERALVLIIVKVSFIVSGSMFKAQFKGPSSYDDPFPMPTVS